MPSEIRNLANVAKHGVRPLFGERIRVLDIAPTLAFSELCRASPDIDYVSLDRESELAMLRGDVQCLPFRRGVFDFVLCSPIVSVKRDSICVARDREPSPCSWPSRSRTTR